MIRIISKKNLKAKLLYYSIILHVERHEAIMLRRKRHSESERSQIFVAGVPFVHITEQ